MPARIISLYAAIVAFLGFKSSKLSPEQIDELIVDSYNKSHESWVARGWIEKPR
jgi:hypothetical protein